VSKKKKKEAKIGPENKKEKKRKQASGTMVPSLGSLIDTPQINTSPLLKPFLSSQTTRCTRKQSTARTSGF
jgi:hypothetical protein